MRVFVEPTGLHSPAMVRVARALERHAPAGVEIVRGDLGRRRADLVVLHLIDFPAEDPPEEFAIIQYCLRTTRQKDPGAWLPLWRRARAVWSYYDLGAALSEIGFCCAAGAGVNFHHAPLGVDDVFVKTPAPAARRNFVLTTGYVAGPPAEALEEVWEAAVRVGLQPVHVGPKRPRGLVRHIEAPGAREKIPDADLVDLLDRSVFVGALRYVEGFEVGAAEALARGARPILFDQPALRRWYESLGIFVPEAHGAFLVGSLEEEMAQALRAAERRASMEEDRIEDQVSDAERRIAAERFDWGRIARGFWDRVLAGSRPAIVTSEEVAK